MSKRFISEDTSVTVTIDRPLDEIQNEHKKIADELRLAILDCIKEFFDGWVPKTNGWTNWFPKQATGPWICTRY